MASPIDLLMADLYESLEINKQIGKSKEIATTYQLMVEDCARAIANNHPIFFAGNGGSFANAQHLAAEFTGKMGRLRKALPAICLGTNNSSLTAVGNDFGYEFTLVREFEALRQEFSVVLALSTSGNSANILKLVESAEKLQNASYAITGESGGILATKTKCIHVPSSRTERIQEFEILIGHSLCYAIEEKLGIFS